MPLGVEPALLFIPVSDRGALHRLRRLRGVELPVALLACLGSGYGSEFQHLAALAGRLQEGVGGHAEIP
jgi:threonyl-tRNA synthetase